MQKGQSVSCFAVCSRILELISLYFDNNNCCLTKLMSSFGCFGLSSKEVHIDGNVDGDSLLKEGAVCELS